MPAGADVREAQCRGSDEGGTLGVGGDESQKKKRAERGRKRDERHGLKRVRHFARGPAGGRACHVIGPWFLQAARAGGHAKASSKHSALWLPPLPKEPPIPPPPTGTAAVVSRGLSSSAPSGLLSG